jgi:uncharacterized protein YyaL (SSP411 family)
LAASRKKLLAVRDKRVRPGKDDKVLVSWNSLMIEAMARAGVILKQASYVSAAEKAAQFIIDKISRKDRRLLHTWRKGKATLDAYLDDYANFTAALITLYESTFNERWIEKAAQLADTMLQHFEDKQRGGFFFTADDHEELIARNKDLHDASVPSGNAMAATALIRLGKLTGKTHYLEAAGRTLATGTPVMERTPTGAGQMLIALDLWLGPIQELVFLGGSDERQNQSLLDDLHATYLPHAVMAYRQDGSLGASKAIATPTLEPLFSGRGATDGQPTLFICENFACQSPVSGVKKVTAAIKQLGSK